MQKKPSHSKGQYFNPDQVLAQHGKSFYWARFFLGKEPSQKATHLYGFCRYLDDIADSQEKDRLEKLLQIKKTINQIDELNNLPPEIATFLKLNDGNRSGILSANDLLEGLISDQDDVLITDEEELIQYSYQVAGSVGLMMAPILKAKNKKSFPFAIDLGIAMQLTNIARDVKEDAIYGRRYIPGILCNSMTPDEIFVSANGDDPQGREAIKKSINHVLTIAEKYYNSGLSGLTYLPIRNHIAIGIAAIIYRQIGRKLMKSGTQWWQGREIVSFTEKFIYSFFIITTLFSRLKSYPSHNKSLHFHLKKFQNINES